jgi:hypothetical protein
MTEFMGWRARVKEIPIDTNEQVYFCYGNHGKNPNQIEDYFYFIRNLVKYALNRDMLMSSTPVPNAINILVEAFEEPHVRLLNKIKRAYPNTKFVCIATEFLTGETFNNFDLAQGPAFSGRKVSSLAERLIPEKLREFFWSKLPAFYIPLRQTFFSLFRIDSQYYRIRYWVRRCRYFKMLIPVFDHVWVVSPQQIDGYRDVVPASKFWHVPILPYVDEAVPPQRHTIKKDVDVLFTGTVTDHRRKFIAELKRSGLNVVTGPADWPEFIRKHYFSRSRLSIHIRQTPTWKYTSIMRLHTLLANDILAVSEKGESDTMHSQYTYETNPEDLVRTCVEMLKKSDAELAQLAFEARARYIRGTHELRQEVRRKLQGLFGAPQLTAEHLPKVYDRQEEAVAPLA